MLQCFQHSVLTTNKKGWNQRGGKKRSENSSKYSHLKKQKQNIFGQFFLGSGKVDDNGDDDHEEVYREKVQIQTNF